MLFKLPISVDRQNSRANQSEELLHTSSFILFNSLVEHREVFWKSIRNWFNMMHLNLIKRLLNSYEVLWKNTTEISYNDLMNKYWHLIFFLLLLYSPSPGHPILFLLRLLFLTTEINQWVWALCKWSQVIAPKMSCLQGAVRTLPYR